MLILTPILIISCIIIVVLLYLFINAIDDERKWLNVLLAVLITPLAYFYIWYPVSTIFLPYHHQKEFNAKKWVEKPGLRYEMIDNMIETNFLMGKTQGEINNLLGKAQWLSWDDATKDYNPNVWNYGVGVIPGIFKNSKEDVEITFKQDKVSQVILSQSPFQAGEKESNSSNKKLDSINATFLK